MSVGTKRGLAWTIFVASCLGLASQAWIEWLLRAVPGASAWSGGGIPQGVLFVGMVLSFLITGLVVATRRPDDLLGWLLLAIGATWGLSPGSYGRYAILVSSLPLGRWAFAFDQWTWVPAIGLLGTYMILLFPDGHLPSPRWRWLGWLTAISLVLASVAVLFSDDPLEVTEGISVHNPFGIPPLSSVLHVLQAVTIVIPFCIVASAVALVMRFRRSTGTERQQIRWLAFAAGLVATLYLITMLSSLPFAFSGEPQPSWLDQLQLYTVFSFALIPIAIGFAVLRYRLWDIDVVISKTVVFGLLAAFITVVYVAVVVGLGVLFGNERSPVLSVAATALVALLFGPVRERVRRFANRLVYGKRATPYEVMAGFAHRVSGSLSIDRVLPQMAEVAAVGVGARAARARVRLPHGVERSRTWPADADGPFERSLDIAYQGEVIGAVDVATRPDQPLRPSEERLLEDLASQAGLALHNVRLTEELQIRAEELAEQTEALRISRERLVTARDAQRRGLERDIREGPERRLHEIRVGLSAVDPEDQPDAERRLDALTGQANETLEGLRDLARGIFPPLLADQGVVAALEAHIRKVGAHAEIDATPAFTAQRYGADVEACLYFCGLQAIQNVIRHAANAPCTVVLDADGAAVRFEIVDGGSGFDPATTRPGMGMDIMQDRIDALEGELSIESAPGHGTTVAGIVPRRAAAALD
jgi:signal transduction histidine kinase